MTISWLSYLWYSSKPLKNWMWRCVSVCECGSQIPIDLSTALVLNMGMSNAWKTWNPIFITFENIFIINVDHVTISSSSSFLQIFFFFTFLSVMRFRSHYEFVTERDTSQHIRVVSNEIWEIVSVESRLKQALEILMMVKFEKCGKLKM